MTVGQCPQHSSAVKDSCQLIRVFAFAVEGAADRREGLGERKNFVCNQQISVFRSDRMPVHTLSCNRDFRHQIGPSNCDTLGCRATQGDPAYYSVLFSNFLLIEELTELLGL